MMAKFHLHGHDSEECVAKFVVAFSVLLTALTLLVLLLDWIMQ